MVSSVGSGRVDSRGRNGCSVQSRASCSGILVNEIAVVVMSCLEFSVEFEISQQGLQYMYLQLVCWRPTERDYRSHRYVSFGSP